MEGMRFIQTIRLDRILSFGPNEEDFALEPLNVLIGPNASGKSNLLEALSLLQAAPRDIQVPTREGGGVREWMWKGDTESTEAKIDVTLRHPFSDCWRVMSIKYRLAFTEANGHFFLLDEVVEEENPLKIENDQPHIYYSYNLFDGQPLIDVFAPVEGNRFKRELKLENLKPNQSILSQIRDPETYPELTYLADGFALMRFYREWNFGRFAQARLPQRTDLQQDRLLEDASNLGLVLNDMMNRPGLKGRLLERMRDFYPYIEDINTTLIGGTVQIFFHEKGLKQAVPATRLSDGSLRYLCLLAVLLHPDPPNVICIEEPELGLHPDIIPEVAKLLIEASSRSQLFVTTHSDVLVDALSEVPEAVVVCEKVDGATQLRRLDAESLKPWLEKYRLGELWTSGRFGGNRW